MIAICEVGAAEAAAQEIWAAEHIIPYIISGAFCDVEISAEEAITQTIEFEDSDQ